MLAKAMIAICVGIALFAIAVLIRSFYRPLNATPQKLAAMKRVLPIVWRLLFGAIAMMVYALVTRQYYLLFASAFFLALVLPIFVHYRRLKSALDTEQK